MPRDASDADAQIVLAMSFVCSGNMPAALEGAKHALTLNRNSAAAHEMLGGTLTYMGRTAEGRSEALIALRNGLSHGSVEIHSPGMALGLVEACARATDDVFRLRSRRASMTSPACRLTEIGGPVAAEPKVRFRPEVGPCGEAAGPHRCRF